MKHFLYGLLLFLPTNVFSQIIINEIMADPSPVNGLPDAEFVEIINLDTIAVNLTGWSFFDGSIRWLPNKTIPANGYAIICSVSDSTFFSPYGLVAPISSLSLTNTADKVALRNPSGLAVDSITYADSWYGDPVKAEGGYSLERIDPEMTCLLPSNWSASLATIGGTPGYANSIMGTVVDNNTPQALYAYGLDSANIVIAFNEPIDLSSINLPSDIELPNPYTATTATAFNETASQLKLSINPPLTPDVVIIMRLVDISDCAGNVIMGDSILKVGLADDTREAKLVINELLFNPPEEGYDFIEILNAGNTTVDLYALQLASISTTTGTIGVRYPITTENRFLYPGSYLVVTSNPESVSKYYSSSFPFSFQESLIPSMNIDEGMVALFADTLELDRVYYHEDYHFPLLLDTKGVSLERIHPDRASMEQHSWHSASTEIGGATPGKPNSQYFSLVKPQGHVTVSPEIFSPNQDGYHDVVTFQINPSYPGTISQIKIVDSNGAYVFDIRERQMLSFSAVMTWDGITNRGDLAPTGIYVALMELFDLNGHVVYEKLPFVLAMPID